MFAAAFEAGGEAEQVRVRRNRRSGCTLIKLRFAFGQRAGFVDHQVSTLSQNLERFGVLDQDAAAGAAAHRHHDRHGRREAERAGAGDDQHGHGVHQRVRQARLRARNEPTRRR